MKDQLEPEIADQWQEINRIAQVLEINAPVGGTTAEERRQWVEWWKPSYEFGAANDRRTQGLPEKWPLVAAALCAYARRCAADRAQDIPTRPLCRPGGTMNQDLSGCSLADVLAKLEARSVIAQPWNG